MKALVTGGTGFIGNNLVRRLVSRGDEVGMLVRENSKTWRISDLAQTVQFLEGDLINKDSLTELIHNYIPNFIYHLSVYGAYPKFQGDLETMISVNIKGTLNLIEAAKDIPIINIGSSSEYGTKNKAMVETDKCHPSNDYGRTKLMQTLYCSELGIPTLRLFSVYGPWEEHTRLIPILIKAKLRDEELHLIDSVREYTYIDDVTDGILMATEKYDKIKGEIINIGSGQQYSMKDILEKIDKIDNRKLNINWDFEAIQVEPKVWVADISKAKKILRWEPRVSLEKGLEKTYLWWKN